MNIKLNDAKALRIGLALAIYKYNGNDDDRIEDLKMDKNGNPIDLILHPYYYDASIMNKEFLNSN